MKILVDFDRVIFNTDKTLQMADELAVKHGANLKVWRAKRPRQRGGRGDLYSIWKHLKFYKKYRDDIDEKAFLKDYEEFHIKAKNVIFPDAEWFLKKIQRYDDRILLTFAEQRFQKFKIKSANVRKYFQKIRIVPSYKAPHLSKLISRTGPTVLIDDNPKEIDGVKRKHPEVITVRVRRPGAWYSTMESKLKDHEAKNLKQVFEILKKIEKQEERNLANSKTRKT